MMTKRFWKVNSNEAQPSLNDQVGQMQQLIFSSQCFQHAEIKIIEDKGSKVTMKCMEYAPLITENNPDQASMEWLFELGPEAI